MDPDSPYRAPVTIKATAPAVPRRVKVELAFWVGLMGGFAFGLLGSFGLTFLILFLDIFLAPPLKNVGNYGQFGFIPVITGFYAAIAGCSMSLCVMIGFRFWLVIYSAILWSYWGFAAEASELYDPSNVVGCAHAMLAILILLSTTVLRLRLRSTLGGDW